MRDTIDAGDFDVLRPSLVARDIANALEEYNTRALNYGGGNLRVPQGVYYLSRAVTLSASNFSLLCDAGAQFFTTSATADTLKITGGNVHIRGGYFGSVPTKSAGSFINIEGANNVSVLDFKMGGAYRGITINGGAIINIGGGEASTIYDSVAGFGRGIYVTGTPFAATIDNVIMDASAGAKPQAGIYLDASGDCVISRCNVIHQDVGLLAAPGNGQAVASLWTTNSFFDNCGYGMRIAPTGSGAVVRSRFADSWFSSATTFGVEIAAATGTTVSGLHFTDPHVMANGNNGLWVSDATTLRDFSVKGGIFAGNSSGIGFSNAATDFSITGAHIGAYGGLSANSGYGIYFGGQVSNCVVSNNLILGNTSGQITFGGSVGSNVIVSDNPGYNPQGPASITVTASPFTYTAGHTAETVFVSGGIVSLVKVAGTTVFATTNVAVPLSAGQACEVTYTVAPTMTKYRH